MTPQNLPNVALFNGVDPAIVEELLETLPVHHFAPGEYLCREGDPGGSMFILQRGLARVVIGDDDSFRRLRRGDVVGEMSLLTGGFPRTASVVASVPTDVLEFDRDVFAATLSRHPELLGNLTRILSERLAHTSQSRSRRSGRGEAITLIVGAGLDRVADEVLDVVGRTSPGSVAAVDLRGGDRPPSDRVEDALASLDDLLHDNRTVTIAVPAEFDHLDLLTLHTDRTILLTGESAAAGTIERLAPDVPFVEIVLVDVAGSPPGEINNVPVIRVIDASASKDARWVGRHLARTKLGLALGAGGAKGYAHVGALRVLEEAGYEVDYVSGSSIGAVVGVCVGLGMDSHAIESTMQKLFTPDNVAEMFKLSFAGTSSGSETMRRMLRELTDDKTFAELALPVVVMTVDLGAKVPQPIASGPLLDALLAATALAGFMPPFRRDDQRLIDALALVPVPSDAVRDAGADVTVSVNIMSRETLAAWPGLDPPDVADKKERMLDVLLEVMDLGQIDASVRHAANADVPITPVFGPGTWRDFDIGHLFLQAGRDATAERLVGLAELSRPSSTTRS